MRWTFVGNPQVIIGADFPKCQASKPNIIVLRTHKFLFGVAYILSLKLSTLAAAAANNQLGTRQSNRVPLVRPAELGLEGHRPQGCFRLSSLQ